MVDEGLVQFGAQLVKFGVGVYLVQFGKNWVFFGVKKTGGSLVQNSFAHTTNLELVSTSPATTETNIMWQQHKRFCCSQKDKGTTCMNEHIALLPA